jgi:hypothetical protein
MEHSDGTSALEKDTFGHTETEKDLKMNIVWTSRFHNHSTRYKTLAASMAHQELLPDSDSFMPTFGSIQRDETTWLRHRVLTKETRRISLER